MKLKESAKVTEPFKARYRDNILEIVRKREIECAKNRKEYRKDIFKNPEKYREEFIKMLGWPLGEKRDTVPTAEQEFVSDEGDFTIYRMHIAVMDDLTITGLLFKKKDDKCRPLILAQHGGEGSPERISGTTEDGCSSNYNEVITRMLKYDVNIFAPQLLLWSVQKYGAEYDRRIMDAQLKRVGSSIAALEIFAHQRILDYFETQPYVKNFGMLGLSYGGFYTLHTTAIDTRIKSAVSCAWWNDRAHKVWPDWVWEGSANSFSDPEVTALVYPRRISIQVGDKDEIFDVDGVQQVWEDMQELSKEVGTDWIEFIIFDGVHEMYKSDEPLEQLAKDLLEE